MTNLASAFIRLAGRAAQGLNNTFQMYCELCGKETTFKLISEVAGTEQYKCTGCNRIVKTYTVK